MPDKRKSFSIRPTVKGWRVYDEENAEDVASFNDAVRKAYEKCRNEYDRELKRKQLKEEYED